MKIGLAMAMGFFLLPSFNHANTLVNTIFNYPQLVQSIENGYDVRGIIHFNKCFVTTSDNSEELRSRLEGVSTGFRFTSFFHAKEKVNEQLVDCVSTFSKMLIESPSGEFFTLLSRLSVFEDNTARLHVVAFDPILNKKRWVVDWLCNMNTAQNGLPNTIQSNFPNNVSSNFPNGVQTNLQNNLQPNVQTNAQGYFQNNLPNNTLQYPLQTNSQEENGLVLFNFPR